MTFPDLPVALRHERLDPPASPPRVVLDTDTYNEVDDQFAVVHALLSPDRLRLEAITAAPFHNANSDGPADGMERSYDEIHRLLDRLSLSGEGRVFRGADRYLPDRETPVENEAAQRIVELARTSDEPLYVAAIGAITNVASALLLAPELVERLVVVWLGGQPLHWPTAKEFNLRQDVPAAQVVFDSGVPVVHIPCQAVASHLLTTMPELATHVQPHGDIGRYLWEICDGYRKGAEVWSKVIWDISATGWLVHAGWVPTDVVPSPILTDQVTWSADASRHGIRVAHHVHRDGIFGDVFGKLQRFAAGTLAPAWS